MKLDKLFKNAPSIDIDNIMVDSRVKTQNGLFFALKGIMNDGHKYIDNAISNGAVAVVYTDELSSYNDNVTYIRVKDAKDILVKTINVFYDNVSSKMKIFAVTGTNGKTTITKLIQDILGHYEKVGYMGTLGVDYEGVHAKASLTTLDINANNKYLYDMYSKGYRACSIEASSIGLDQGRLANIDFDYAIFTNFTHDHLDYHNTMEHYFEAKKILFDVIKKEGHAIINVDDPVAYDLVKDTKAKIHTYGVKNDADYRACDIELFGNKTRFTLKTRDADYRIETNLVAEFNVYNLLATICTLHTYGLSMDQIMSHLKTLKQVEGRMEQIDCGQSFNVIVDFAHTPDGIEKVMKFASSITPSDARIILVMGSAGKRDYKKRIVFGELADRYCDMIILTEDDPRDEKVVDIANEIAKGIINTNYIIVEDRYMAIKQAIELVNSKDTILILGKGDETFIYREYGDEPYIGDNNAVKQIIDEISEEEAYDD